MLDTRMKKKDNKRRTIKKKKNRIKK